jgi:nucleoside 2-deoxyribosyltransferase
MIYLIGSLRNPEVQLVAGFLREQLNEEVFDDWASPGPRTDEHWQGYENGRGRTYAEALQGLHAKHVFEFDREHLIRADRVVLVLPAGRSAHLELGWILGQGKPGYVLLEANPTRYDIMYQFANGIASSQDELVDMLRVRKELNAFTSQTTHYDKTRGGR